MDAAVAAALAEAHRQEWGYVLAATARITRDLDTAEECVQDAYAQALTAWAASAVPAKPGAWLTTVARRRAMDMIRRNDTLRAKLPLLAAPDLDTGPDALIEAADLDEALVIAKAVPCPYGWVELRPVMPGSEYRPA